MATQNYQTIKNASLVVPTTTTDLGTPTQPYGNLYLQGNITLNNATTITSTSAVNPKISSVAYPGSATAANPTGGETITVNGSGFVSGIATYVANTIVSVTNFVNSNQLTFAAPAQTAGSYSLSVVNSDGGTASYIPGLTYSALPVWSTSAGSLGTALTGNTISTITLAATENSQSITYAVTSGSLPAGLSLSSSGAITGTLFESAATYNFTVTATDPQGQTATRNFSYTVTAPAMIAATGGTVTTSGNYKFHTFITSGTFTITSSPAASSIQYLVVAGGGSGGTGYAYGGFAGGGGGAGGYLTGTISNPTVQSYTITIGGGGAAVTGRRVNGNKGTNSSAFGSTSIGGGYGGGASSVGGGGSGGSGGGGATNYSGAAGTSSQGNDGGRAGANNGGGGGGGAGAPGDNGNDSSNVGTGGAGGAGSTWLDGNTYAGGGGGASGGGFTGASSGAGGTGGGGAGGRCVNIGSPPVGSNGTDNTGGGGGGGPTVGDTTTGAGSKGGSGVVIIRYQYQ